MNFVLASDNGYIDHCATTMTSILVNNKGANVFVLTEWLSEENVQRLKKIAKSFNGNVEVVQVDSAKLQDFPMPKDKDLAHISIATYYRLFVATLLPSTVDKVIYLDCDTVVRRPLDEMWNIDMEDYALGAVYQMCDWNVAAAERLHFDPKYGYFNAGVLIMNLKYWREKNIQTLLMSTLREIKNDLKFHDQDVLNAALHAMTKRIPCSYNMLTSYFSYKVLKSKDATSDGKVLNDHADYKSILKAEIRNPHIVHYVSRPKPWEKMCFHPYRNDYFKYAKMCNAYHYLGLIDKLYNICRYCLWKASWMILA